MKPKTIAVKRLKYLINDERKANKEYAILYESTGDERFRAMSQDEARHRGYLEQMLNEIEGQ